MHHGQTDDNCCWAESEWCEAGTCDCDWRGQSSGIERSRLEATPQEQEYEGGSDE